jgi:hypothetical protein
MTLFGITTKEKIISVAILLLVLMVLGFQKVPPEEMAKVRQEQRQSEQRLEEAKARLQRAWDNSPANPVRK